MSKSTLLFGGVSIALGAAAIGVDTGSNVEFVLQGGPASPSLVAAVIVVALLTAGSLSVMGTSWRRRHLITAMGALLMFGAGAAFSLTATLDRVASSRDSVVQQARSSNRAVTLVEEALAEAQAKVETAEHSIAGECDGLSPERARTLIKRYPRCNTALNSRTEARESVSRLRTELASAGAKTTENSMGERIAALIPGVTPDDVTLYQPVLLPVALFLGGNLFFAFGVSLIAGNGHSARSRSEDAQGGVAANDLVVVSSRTDQVRAFMAEFQLRHGRAPTFNETLIGTGLPRSTVSRERNQCLAA